MFKTVYPIQQNILLNRITRRNFIVVFFNIQQKQHNQTKHLTKDTIKLPRESIDIKNNYPKQCKNIHLLIQKTDYLILNSPFFIRLLILTPLGSSLFPSTSLVACSPNLF